MRIETPLKDGWIFKKNGESTAVSLPHTWNAGDGQCPAYFRGECSYIRFLEKAETTTYLKFLGANLKTTVFINSRFVGGHLGGYSEFSFDITNFLTLENNKLEVLVSNADCTKAYPSIADFTFYGGLYRDVYLVLCEKTHFALEGGLKAAAVKEDGKWLIKAAAVVSGEDKNFQISYELKNQDGEPIKRIVGEIGSLSAHFEVEKPVLWQGLENPYLYTLTASLYDSGKQLDEITVEIGFREIYIDAEKGFFLNGKPLKIRGVCRHQDRAGAGNALLPEHHEEDIKIILESGANAVRLAHYQQSQYFYSLCDRAGLLVWAEVPVISKFSPKKQKNALSQLGELIEQSFNHPSVFCWGIQNEITLGGAPKKLKKYLSELNVQAHRLDETRYTASAQLSLCPKTSPLNSITDILGYNHYFGWYLGIAEDLDSWLDAFFKAMPKFKLCLSEYGAEGVLKYQSEVAAQGDYSESYQAEFHQKYLKIIDKYPNLWGSFVWNMFDFASASRNEGGTVGMNNKGLVTMDRAIKKDAFYLYKAHWSKEKFVHIAGRRHLNRPIGKTAIKIYTNLDFVELTVNGESIGTKSGEVTLFENVEIKAGENIVKASSGDYFDEIVLIGVAEEDKSYVLTDKGNTVVRNWFAPGEKRTDMLSADDRISDILKNKEAMELLSGLYGNLIKSPLLKLLGRFTVRRIASLKVLGFDKEAVELADRFLQTIKK